MTVPVLRYSFPGMTECLVFRCASLARLSKSLCFERHLNSRARCPGTPIRRFHMQYILMLYARESGWSELTQAQQEQAMGAYNAYTEALKNAGVLKGVNRLQSTSTATTVRVANGKSQVLDAPYPASKYRLRGSYTIHVPHPHSPI